MRQWIDIFCALQTICAMLFGDQNFSIIVSLETSSGDRDER